MLIITDAPLIFKYTTLKSWITPRINGASNQCGSKVGPVGWTSKPDMAGPDGSFGPVMAQNSEVLGLNLAGRMFVIGVVLIQCSKLFKESDEKPPLWHKKSGLRKLASHKSVCS